MPLEEGKSKEVRQRNIKKLISEGYPPKQAVAIEYSRERKNILERINARKNKAANNNVKK